MHTIGLSVPMMWRNRGKYSRGLHSHIIMFLKRNGYLSGGESLKIKRTKTLALFAATCMVFAMCMTSFVVAVDATSFFEESGYITHDELVSHAFNIPAGYEVKVQLDWEDTQHDWADLDFYVWDNGNFLIAGASLGKPEVAFLSEFAVDTTIYVYIYGWYVPEPGVDYSISVTLLDAIPEPYAEPGGLTVGDLTSWHYCARQGVYSADARSAHSYVMGQDPWRQTLMPWFTWQPWHGNPPPGTDWGAPAFYAGDPLLVGGLTYWWWMDYYTRKEAQADLDSFTVEYRVDGIPLEELGHVSNDPIRPDNERGQWYWRLPTIIFKPGELYDVLYDPLNEDDLHYFEYYLNDVQMFIGYFYLVW
jgi:hypothetical protein